MNAQVFSRKATSRLLLAVALALTIVAGPASPPRAAARPAPVPQLIVDHDGDESLQLCVTGTDNDCSLRSAIEKANGDSTPYDIVFADNYTITLGSALPVITTTMSIRGQGALSETRTININADGHGNVFKIQASNVHIDHLYLYGAGGGYSNIWITGSAKNVVISNNVIGHSFGGPCSDVNAYGGVYINSTGSLGSGDKRAWIYANHIVCHQSTTGEGITISGTDGVAIGEDADGNASWAQTNYIDNNRVGAAIRGGSASDNTVRNSYINNNLDVGVLISGGKGNTVRGNWITYNNHNGVQVEDATSNTIGYLTSEPFTLGNIISNNGEYGVVITGTTTASNQVVGNRIGTDSAGTAAAANGWAGIYVGGSASETYINKNLISGNGWGGVWLQNASVTTVTHNYIGTNISGTAAISNSEGVALTDGTNHARIGGSNTGDGNLISGNTYDGVRIEFTATNNLVLANLIGTNVNGTAALANGRDGVRIAGSGTDNNQVDGTTSADRNVISGNDGSGVLIDGADWTSVAGNLIGLNATGTAAIANKQAGVAVWNGLNTSIGRDYGIAQYISGNEREGIYMYHSAGIGIRPANYIGVAGDGVTLLGNGLEGVKLDTGVHGVYVQPALVAYNGRAGIAACSGAGWVTIDPQEVRNHEGLPIDLGNDGATPNDASDHALGPDGWLDYPVAAFSSGQLITGTSCAECQVSAYEAIGNPAANGGGGRKTSLSVWADSSGVWTMTLPITLTRASITLQAWKIALGSSEMSPRPVVYLPVVLRQ
jgi:parallel beta-helix repeat protein